VIRLSFLPLPSILSFQEEFTLETEIIDFKLGGLLKNTKMSSKSDRIVGNFDTLWIQQTFCHVEQGQIYANNSSVNHPQER